MRRVIVPPAHPRTRLRLIQGGLSEVRDEARVSRHLWPYERRVVRAEPRPQPPKDAA